VVPLSLQGNNCIGEEGDFLGGYLADWYAKMQFDVHSPDTWFVKTHFFVVVI
jgi:hypothetical protein